MRDEPLRSGARELIRELWLRGWEVWIYTTSYRDPLSVRTWLFLHGVRVAGVINQDVHDARLRKARGGSPSKNPAAFGIHLHIDDSEGVREEGRQFGFRVVVLSPDDVDWVQKVQAAAPARR